MVCYPDEDISETEQCNHSGYFNCGFSQLRRNVNSGKIICIATSVGNTRSAPLYQLWLDAGKRHKRNYLLMGLQAILNIVHYFIGGGLGMDKKHNIDGGKRNKCFNESTMLFTVPMIFAATPSILV